MQVELKPQNFSQIFQINQGLMSTIVFPGQGSQSIGMTKDFHDNFNKAKLIFEEIEDHTHIAIRKIIFDNDEKKLELTKYTQICIFSVSYVIFDSIFSIEIV